MAEKRPTIADIAKLANTSTATVSHYLNGKYDKMSEATRRTIADAVTQTGYVPSAAAQNLASKATGVIAVLILDNTNVWAGQLVSGVEEVAYRCGYQTVVCDTHFDHKMERDYVEKMLSLGVDGFVVQPTSHYRSVSERIRRAGKPVVFYDFNVLDLQSTWVKSDLYGGMYDAVSTCMERGYEEFVILSANAAAARTRSERVAGILDALAEKDIEGKVVPIARESPTVEELRRYFELETSPARRTLVVCPHQWALSRAYKALAPMRHLMPEKIGLLGLNCGDWADLTEPGITTVIEPVQQEGRIACAMLVDLMGDPTTGPRQEMLSCRTRWLGSTL